MIDKKDEPKDASAPTPMLTVDQVMRIVYKWDEDTMYDVARNEPMIELRRRLTAAANEHP